MFGRGREGYAKAGKLIAEIERKHPAVANQFGTGAGLRLMRKDSEITEYILGKLLRGGHFALPIHDSYRVPRQIADRTRAIMDEALAKATRKPTRVSMAISSAQVTDKTAKALQVSYRMGWEAAAAEAAEAQVEAEEAENVETRTSKQLQH